MRQSVRIDTITLKRDLQPGDDITALAVDIKEHGQQIPVIVNQKFELIDGLRRIKAIRLNGGDKVSTVVGTTFDEVIAVLQQSRQHGVEWRKPSPKRLWELNQALAPYVRRRTLENKKQLVGKPAHSKMEKTLVSSRLVLSQALGLGNSESHLGESVHLWNLVHKPEDYRYELAKELAEAVERGEVPLHGVRSRLERAEIFHGDVLTPGEQRQLLQAFILSLSGVVKSVQRIGPLNRKIPKRELRSYLEKIRVLRRELYIFERTFEQETEK